MSNETSREEVDKLLARANELIGKTPVNWRDVRELMDKLRAVVREAEHHEPDESREPA